MSSPTTAYEKSQSFNPLMKWVHSHRFKEVAQIIGTFNRPLTIYDIGCGYAHLYDVLKDFKANYIGIDNHPDFVAGARARHRALNFKVFHASSANFLPDEPINVVTALETLEHMTEKDAAKTLDNILKISPDMLICSVPVETGFPLLLKNVASFLMRYTRHTEYTWKETFYAALSRLDKLPAPHGQSQRF
jgi:SAM-dependent methyltransferase